MSTKKNPTKSIQMVALSRMEPESGYQRATNAAQVEDIVNNFDSARLGVLTVSERDGKYHLVDGAHRSKALRKLGISHAPCVVLTGLTFRQEAELFRTQNDGKRLLKPMDFYKAGLVSGNEQCVMINKLVRANGFEIGKGNNDFTKIAAIQSLLAISEEYGYDVLDKTLFLIANTWNGIAKASQSECLLGVAEFVSRYGVVDFAERLKSKFSAILYDYTEIVRYRTSTISATSRKKFCRVLVEHYNKTFPSKCKKRLKWEDYA